jgi:hypothetical protein
VVGVCGFDSAPLVIEEVEVAAKLVLVFIFIDGGDSFDGEEVVLDGDKIFWWKSCWKGCSDSG